jgi:hypothetical protein
VKKSTGQLSFDESSFRTERENILEAVREDQTTTKAASAAAEVRGELRSITSSVDRTNGELKRMVGRKDSLTNRLELAREEAERFRTDCDEAGAVEAPLVDEVDPCATTLPRRRRAGPLGSKHSRWRSMPHAPVPGRNASRALTVFSEPCST